MVLLEHAVLLIMPVTGPNLSAIAVLVHNIILWAEKVCNRVARLWIIDGNDAVNARVQLVTRCKSERVTNVNNGMPSKRLEKLPCFSTRALNLQTPLLAKEKGQRSNVGVLLMSNTLIRPQVARCVAEHDKRGVGRVVVTVKALKPSITGTTHGV